MMHVWEAEPQHNSLLRMVALPLVNATATFRVYSDARTPSPTWEATAPQPSPAQPRADANVPSNRASLINSECLPSES
jgi:hypothetical protein